MPLSGLTLTTSDTTTLANKTTENQMSEFKSDKYNHLNLNTKHLMPPNYSEFLNQDERAEFVCKLEQGEFN